jgi:hypothetical protein
VAVAALPASSEPMIAVAAMTPRTDFNMVSSFVE